MLWCFTGLDVQLLELFVYTVFVFKLILSYMAGTVKASPIISFCHAVEYFISEDLDSI